MSSTKLIRWGGLALMLAGVFLALFFLLHPGGGDPPTVAAALNSLYGAEHTLGVAAMVLMLFGVVGLYAHWIANWGRLGLIGFLLSFIGTALLLGVIFFDAYFVPIIAADAPKLLDTKGPLNTLPGVLALALPGVIWGVGFILLGIAIMRTSVLPRWGGLLLIIGAIVLNLPPQPIGPVPLFVLTIGAIVFCVGLALLGYALWSEKGEMAAQPKPAM